MIPPIATGFPPSMCPSRMRGSVKMSTSQPMRAQYEEEEK
jgi:hypothetical protein